MYVTVLMDVEDLVSLEADDIAAKCAQILSEEGVRATLCVVGEKACLLRERGRDDVITEMRRHDIGLHTDFHSIHPTIAEAMESLDWEDGVREAVRRELPGVDAITQIFGETPSCWGGPGNTWGPQVCGALMELAIPSFVYSHTSVPGGGVHRFLGRLAYPNGPGLDDGAYQNDASAEVQLANLERTLREAAANGMYWSQAFIGHPTRILHTEFWDAPNFAFGANPPRTAWVPAGRKSQVDLDRALVNFRKAVRVLGSLPGIELRTIREMNALLDPIPSTPLTPKEQNAVWPTISANLSGMSNWPIMPAGFEPTRITALTKERVNTLERLRLTGQ